MNNGPDESTKPEIGESVPEGQGSGSQLDSTDVSGADGPVGKANEGNVGGLTISQVTPIAAMFLTLAAGMVYWGLENLSRIHPLVVVFGSAVLSAVSVFVVIGAIWLLFGQKGVLRSIMQKITGGLPGDLPPAGPVLGPSKIAGLFLSVVVVFLVLMTAPMSDVFATFRILQIRGETAPNVNELDPLKLQELFEILRKDSDDIAWEFYPTSREIEAHKDGVHDVLKAIRSYGGTSPQSFYNTIIKRDSEMHSIRAELSRRMEDLPIVAGPVEPGQGVDGQGVGDERSDSMIRRADLARQIATISFVTGDYGRAQDELEELAENDQLSPQGYLLLSATTFVLRESQDEPVDDALEYAEKVVSDRSETPVLLIAHGLRNQAFILWRADSIDQSIEKNAAALHAYEGGPSTEEAQAIVRARLGELYWSRGSSDSAVKHWSESAKLFEKVGLVETAEKIKSLIERHRQAEIDLPEA